MAGFRSLKRATGEQAALKIGLYGPPGSGKSFTSLLMAEGLAKTTGKRIAYFDTERGTDFYCKTVPTRKVHPEAFDFDAAYTRSVTEVADAVHDLDPQQYGIIVIDSITHIWDAAMAAYAGKQTSIGSIPMQAWGKIKKPYLNLLAMLLASPMHVLICGRQAVEYSTDEETDQLKAIGVKMKAEASTAYEPHILIRMEAIRPKRTMEIADIVAYAEKDRTGVLAGRSFVNPTFESLCKPLLGLLGGEQAKMATTDETASQDAEALSEADRMRETEGAELHKMFAARITLVKELSDLKAIGGELTPKVKAKMGPDSVAELRTLYQAREKELTAVLI